MYGSFAFDTLCFCLFYKVLIFTFLLGIEFLVDKNSFSVAVEVSFRTLNMSSHCLLSSMVSDWSSAITAIVYDESLFLAAFKIVCLSFWQVDYLFPGVAVFLQVYPT